MQASASSENNVCHLELVVMCTDGHGAGPADCNDGNDLVQKPSEIPLSGWDSNNSNFRSYSVPCEGVRRVVLTL